MILLLIFWLPCFLTTLYVLDKRNQLNGLTIFLALFCWPLALVVAFMVPADAMKPKPGPPISESERPLSERLTIPFPVNEPPPSEPTMPKQWIGLTPRQLDEALRKERLKNKPPKKQPPAKDNKDKGFIWYAIKNTFLG